MCRQYSLDIQLVKQIHIDDIKKQLDSGIGINTLVRNMFADQFVYTVGGRYYFTPINGNFSLFFTVHK